MLQSFPPHYCHGKATATASQLQQEATHTQNPEAVPCSTGFPCPGPETMLPILQLSPGDSPAAVENHFATLCIALSPLNNRIEEQSRFFLERPVSSSAYPALKTHCSHSTCVPHVFWGARTRLMRCSPSATGKCIVRIREYTQTESTVCCKSLHCKRNARGKT